MDPAEKLRLTTLAEIVGADAVEKYAFYDAVDYDTLVAAIDIVEAGNLMGALRDVRKLADIPLVDAKRALTDQGRLHCIMLGETPGSLERWRAIVCLQKMKQAIADNGGFAAINLQSQDGEFCRVDCCDQELEYVITRILTWM